MPGELAVIRNWRKALMSPTISPEAKWFGLRFAGAQGHDTLTWTLAEKP